MATFVSAADARDGKAEFCRRHLGLIPDAPARTGGRKAGSPALGDELPLELGERSEDAEHKFAGGCRRVDRRALAGEHAQADSAGGEIMHRVDQVAKIAAVSRRARLPRYA